MLIADYVRPDRSGSRVLRWETIALLRDTAFWSTLETQGDTELDLSGIDIFSHDGLIWLCAIALQRRNTDRRTYITLPMDERQLKYICKLGFPELDAAAGFIFTNEYLIADSRRDYSVAKGSSSFERICAVSTSFWHSFGSSEGLSLEESVARQLARIRGRGAVLSKDSEYYEGIQPYVKILRELVQNIVLHGGARGNGFGFVAYTPLPSRLRKLRFTCADAGPGLRHTLYHQHDIRANDDRHAVACALLLRGLGAYAPDGTAGLFSALGFIAKQKGSISIRSGESCTTLNLSNENTATHFQRITDVLLRRTSLQRDNTALNAFSQLLTTVTLPHVPGVHIMIDMEA